MGVIFSPKEGQVWQDFIIHTDKRDQLYDFLKEQGIETMKNEYPFPILKLPKSIQYEKETLRLPIYPELTDKQVDYTINKIKEFYENTRHKILEKKKKQ